MFAVANATELAFGKDPLLCRYDTEVMQIHLLQCLENRKLERFPIHLLHVLLVTDQASIL